MTANARDKHEHATNAKAARMLSRSNGCNDDEAVGDEGPSDEDEEASEQRRRSVLKNKFYNNGNKPTTQTVSGDAHHLRAQAKQIHGSSFNKIERY